MKNKVYTDPNYLVALWLGPRDVMFSYARRGNAMSCHFATDDGQKHIRPAIEDFISWVFTQYSWCRMILAQTKKKSVARLLERIEFKFVIETGGCRVYQRSRGYGRHS